MTARTVLIAEVDPWVLRLLEVGMRDLGYEPIIARDGQEAVEVFAETLTDAVLANTTLPVVDGFDLCRRIKSSRAGAVTPVIAYGGALPEKEVLSRSRADAFFPMPLSPDALAARLAELVPPVLDLDRDDALTPAERGEISLGAQPLPLALARLYQQKQSGTLRIRVPKGDAQLVLRDGRIVGVLSDGWRETMSELLLRLRRLSAEELAPIRRAGERPEDWYEVGAAAVTKGLLQVGEPERLWASSQVARVVEAFRWTEGFHSFNPEPATPTTADLMLDTPGLIHWGLRRATLPDQALEQSVPSLTGWLVRNPDADAMLRLFPLSVSERWLLDHADGSTSLQTLAQQVAGNARATDALTRSAIVLHALGVLGVEIPRIVPERPPEEDADGEEPQVQVFAGGPAQILLGLWQDAVTGIFSAQGATNRYILYLRRGQLVASRANEVEKLDSLLAQRGRIRAELLPRIRQLVDAGKNVGEALIEERAIAGPQLQAFVRGEIRAALAEMFKEQELEVSFTELPLPLSELAPHEWDTAQAVVEVARAQDLSEVRRLIPPPDAIISQSPEQEIVPVLALSQAERNLWNLIASPQPWRRLTGGGLVALPDQQRAVGVLLTLGLVRVLDSAAPAENPPSLPPPVRNATLPARRRSREMLALPDEEPVESAPASPAGDMVPRELYEAVLREKEALERRLAERTRDDDGVVSREVYEEALREKIELKARLAELLGERPRTLMEQPEEAEDVPPGEKTGRFLRPEITEGGRVVALHLVED